MKKVYIFMLFSCLLKYSLQRSTLADNHYVAAVVEYQVSRDVVQNRQNYIDLIGQAAQQNADIVVFPELTLTNNSVSFSVPIYGLLKEYPIPALHPEIYDDLFVSMSAAARNNQIYVVLNTRELLDCTRNDTGEECPELKEYIFNTNVVFDRNGTVIDRYRKINLFGEASHTPALHPDLGVFTTDFGVTFGHFICFDLMFQVPAVQIVQKHRLTDVIFTTMWFSELPYLTAVEIQESYAYSMDINFLASGANNPSVGSAGSGIYSGKAGALVSTMPGKSVTRLLVATVPKIPGQNIGANNPGPIYDNPTDHDGLVLITDPSLPSHVSRPLVPGQQTFTLVDKDVRCSFIVKMSNREGNSHYNYRALAFSGVRTFSGIATGGSRVCSVVACTGDTIDTCGKRFPNYLENATAIFEELSINAIIPTPIRETDLQADDSIFIPLSVNVNIMALKSTDFNYNKVDNGNTTTHSYTLVNKNAELYTFALWGRVFATDGLDVDPPRNETEDTSPDSSVVHLVNSVLLIPTILLLLRR
ncbi:hypothetical protein K1T71_011208 [Dendrolimus kikuchii]|uniref:Uncharacterized protein n=1 Tax=Dendrolimus kikuchii TaxID=765133 RepID=A0ACC1CNH5_9NEOP|nr:hypothetical protein K1T71_011208 [Dendrolimus kikuchii]